MTLEVKSSNDLLAFLDRHKDTDPNRWFSFAQQRMTGVALCHAIAANHADKFSPEQIVDYVVSLNNAVYTKMIRNKTS